ncbi:MAG: hypothetical protein WHS83_06040 [Chloroflexus sp.]|uniref:hypothetical protein n=1 Tax=Chloroflexus sp. TaxID=1904827 RepID=UPI0030B42FF3
MTTIAGVGLIALPARRVRVAPFGVRQHGCRASRTHDPARGMPLTRLVTRMLWVLATIGVGRQ